VKEAGIEGIGEVVQFLGLPGSQTFERVFVLANGSGQLPGKNRRVSGKVKRLGGENSGGLMIPMVLAGNACRQPGQHDLRTGQAKDADDLLDDRSRRPGSEGNQNVLTRCVPAIEEPDVGDAQRTYGSPALAFPYQPERASVFPAGGIGSRVAAR